MDWCRKDGSLTKITKAQVEEAVDGQLKRLGVDYIDILQFQWPERYVPYQGTTPFYPALERKKEEMLSIPEQLEIIQGLVKAGKIRHFGLSNESPYGVGAFSMAAETLNLPRPVSLQIPINMVERHDNERYYAEACAKSCADMAIIAHSPLAGGVLSGKYTLQSDIENRFRLCKYPGFTNRYLSKEVQYVMDGYCAYALQRCGIPVSVFALAWLYSQNYVFSTLLGVSKPSQFIPNFQALNLVPFSEPELDEQIDKIHKEHYEPTKGVKHMVRGPIANVEERGFKARKIRMSERTNLLHVPLPPEIEFLYDQFLEDSETKLNEIETRDMRERYKGKII
jgi:aryl-alcohol dehydrogenase-like predicted oxidoreductase